MQAYAKRSSPVFLFYSSGGFMQINNHFYGIDVSSRWLDIASDHSQVIRIDNTLDSVDLWLTGLPNKSVVAMEATSQYHLLVAKLAYSKGMIVYVLNPREVHHYARGVGRRHKSDKVDALLIKRYIEKENDCLTAWTPPTEAQEKISILIKRRSHVVVQKQSLTLSCKDIKHLSQELEVTLNALQKLADELERLILKEIKSNKQQAHLFNLLKSIPGIGKLTAAFFTNLLSHSQFKNADQLVCFMGMDLQFFDSGLMCSKRKLSKRGSSEARRLLFNCARAASQGKLKPLYENYASRMNHTKSTVAVMRKLIKLIYGVWKSGISFDISKFQSPLLNNA